MVKINAEIYKEYNCQSSYLEGSQCAFFKRGKVGVKVYKSLGRQSVEIIRRRQIIAYNAGIAPKVRSKTIAIEDKNGEVFYGYITDLAIILPTRFNKNYQLKLHDLSNKIHYTLSVIFPHIDYYDVHDENYGIDLKTGQLVCIDFDFSGDIL